MQVEACDRAKAEVHPTRRMPEENKRTLPARGFNPVTSRVITIPPRNKFEIRNAVANHAEGNRQYSECPKRYIAIFKKPRTPPTATLRASLS